MVIRIKQHRKGILLTILKHGFAEKRRQRFWDAVDSVLTLEDESELFEIDDRCLLKFESA